MLARRILRHLAVAASIFALLLVLTAAGEAWHQHESLFHKHCQVCCSSHPAIEVASDIQSLAPPRPIDSLTESPEPEFIFGLTSPNLFGRAPPLS